MLLNTLIIYSSKLKAHYRALKSYFHIMWTWFVAIWFCSILPSHKPMNPLFDAWLGILYDFFNIFISNISMRDQITWLLLFVSNCCFSHLFIGSSEVELYWLPCVVANEDDLIKGWGIIPSSRTFSVVCMKYITRHSNQSFNKMCSLF